MVASNTKDCFRECVGHTIRGVLFDALPYQELYGRGEDLAAGTKTLVLDDGRGLTISNDGTFWIASAGDVRRAVVALSHRLEKTKADIEKLLALQDGDSKEEPKL